MRFQTQFITKQREITEEMYNKMMDVLPPKIIVDNAFLVGECYDHTSKGTPRYALYFTEDGKYYYGGVATVGETKLWFVKDEPEPGETYVLTGSTENKTISNGNSWKESLITN